MKDTWFAGNFCPKDAECSLEDGALTPSNGPKIRTMTFTTPPEEIYTATVQAFANEAAFYQAETNPEDWTKCEGQIVSINQHIALFSILGDMYGGDGQTTFGLPDLHNEPVPDGAYYIYTWANVGHGRT